MCTYQEPNLKDELKFGCQVFGGILVLLAVLVGIVYLVAFWWFHHA